MNGQLRAELLKHRSTFTNLGLLIAMLGLLIAMLGLVLLAVLLHGLTLPADRLESASDQVQVFRFGSLLGALFAGLVGAMSITGEIRHGTIRPTFLITPRRGRVVAAKIVASALVGIVFGLVAVSAAVGAGSAALAARGIPITLDGSDYTLMPAGGIAAAALWAPLGLGLGALLRNQVATLLAIFLWLFFVENLLLDFVPGAGRFAPGAAAAAITGLDPRQAARPRPRCAPARPLRRDNRGRRLDRHPPPRCPLNRIPGARAVAVRRPLRVTPLGRHLRRLLSRPDREEAQAPTPLTASVR